MIGQEPCDDVTRTWFCEEERSSLLFEKYLGPLWRGEASVGLYQVDENAYTLQPAATLTYCPTTLLKKNREMGDCVLRVLLLGLGDDPGHIECSYVKWKATFGRKVHMHICEEDQQLAWSWYTQGKIAHGDMDVMIHAGDTDLQLLSRNVSFDIVIESATFRERQASPISNIIPLMSAGGLYFLSGLRTSNQTSLMEQVKDELDVLHNRNSWPNSWDITSIDCTSDLCVFVHRPSHPLGQYGPSEFHMAAAALNPVTDKITRHSYDLFYEKYLNSIRLGGSSIAPYNNQGHLLSIPMPMRFLEIGLGCGMPYGPGASYPLWKGYFKTPVEYHIFEYSEQCAREWEQNVKPEATLHIGDQANVAHLQAMLDKIGGPIDILVEDGGHTMNQQITSFNYLFPHLRVGGLYFLEDLETSYLHNYGGGYKSKNTTVEYIKSLLDNLNGLGPEGPVSDLIASIDCQRELCVFVRGENRPKP